MLVSENYLTVKTAITEYKLNTLKHSPDGSTTHVCSPFEPLFRGVRVNVHISLVADWKAVVDFLFAIIELFFTTVALTDEQKYVKIDFC